MQEAASTQALYELPALPYAYDALEPVIDQETVRIHHDKHHQAYLTNLLAALDKHPELKAKSPEQLLRDLTSVPEDIRTAVRNHGGGHVHHSIYWTMMKPNGGGAPTGKIAGIIQQLGGFEAFKAKFNDMGLKHFGSGWVWLVRTPQAGAPGKLEAAAGVEGKYEIVTTPNQDSPLTQGLYPIMVNDVWEHAYYLKYQNRRADYLQAWWNVVNWDEINRRIETV
jgi:superoxide dismutase, Fe-Mn family